MPRLTPCRILRVLALPWLTLFALWCFLPSPLIPADQHSAYIQRRLASGRSIVSVVDYAPYKREARYTYSGECSECSSLIFNWRLSSSPVGIILSLDDESDAWNTARINLTGVLAEAADWNSHQKTSSRRKEGGWTPYFSAAIKLRSIPGGSLDEEINLPWFPVADQHRFHNDMHGFTAEVALRAFIPEPGTVEFWSFYEVNRVLEGLQAQSKNQTVSPEMLSDALSKDPQRTGYLATFKVPSVPVIANVVVQELRGDLPSKMYPIRKALLFPLGPILPLVFILAGVASDTIAPVFPFLVVAVIIFVLWRVTTVMKRSTARERDVWGPTGPVDVKSREEEFDEEKEVGLQRPQTVRLGKSWK